MKNSDGYIQGRSYGLDSGQVKIFHAREKFLDHEY